MYVQVVTQFTSFETTYFQGRGPCPRPRGPRLRDPGVFPRPRLLAQRPTRGHLPDGEDAGGGALPGAVQQQAVAAAQGGRQAPGIQVHARALELSKLYFSNDVSVFVEGTCSTSSSP